MYSGSFFHLVWSKKYWYRCMLDSGFRSSYAVKFTIRLVEIEAKVEHCDVPFLNISEYPLASRGNQKYRLFGDRRALMHIHVHIVIALLAVNRHCSLDSIFKSVCHGILVPITVSPVINIYFHYWVLSFIYASFFSCDTNKMKRWPEKSMYICRFIIAMLLYVRKLISYTMNPIKSCIKLRCTYSGATCTLVAHKKSLQVQPFLTNIRDGEYVTI